MSRSSGFTIKKKKKKNLEQASAAYKETFSGVFFTNVLTDVLKFMEFLIKKEGLKADAAVALNKYVPVGGLLKKRNYEAICSIKQSLPLYVCRKPLNQGGKMTFNLWGFMGKQLRN